jgi:hypothetical protein
MQSRYKRPVGWFNESERHSLSARGVKTGRKINYSLENFPANKYRLDIAIKTLRMPDAIANIIGGVTKKEAREYLKSRGYDDEQIRDIDNGNTPKHSDYAKKRFQDVAMQNMYESMLKDGMHYRKAERETIRRFKEYDDTDFAKTEFGILQPSGKVAKSMSIDISKVKSDDPLAYSYGYFQAKSGQLMSKDKDLAPEYIRGYKDAKAGKKIDTAKKSKKVHVLGNRYLKFEEDSVNGMKPIKKRGEIIGWIDK